MEAAGQFTLLAGLYKNTFPLKYWEERLRVKPGMGLQLTVCSGLSLEQAAACNCSMRWQRRSGFISLSPSLSQREGFLFEILQMLFSSWKILGLGQVARNID